MHELISIKPVPRVGTQRCGRMEINDGRTEDDEQKVEVEVEDKSKQGTSESRSWTKQSFVSHSPGSPCHRSESSA